CDIDNIISTPIILSLQLSKYFLVRFFYGISTTHHSCYSCSSDSLSKDNNFCRWFCLFYSLFCFFSTLFADESSLCISSINHSFTLINLGTVLNLNLGLTLLSLKQVAQTLSNLD